MKPTKSVYAKTLYKDAEVAITGQHGIRFFFKVKGVTRNSKSIYVHTYDNFTMVFMNHDRVELVL